MEKLCVKLRDGSELCMGDECTTDISPKCVGETFIVCEMREYRWCESGVLVVVHLKGDPERKLLGLKVEGFEFVDGVDSNWFIVVKSSDEKE